jgi:hypothetical protein
MPAAPEPTVLTVEYLLDGLMSQRTEIQQQIIEQSLGQSMLPKGLLNGLRRAYDLMLQDLFQEESNLELAIGVLEKGGPGCMEAAFAILSTPANMLGHVSFNLLGTVKEQVLH